MIYKSDSYNELKCCLFFSIGALVTISTGDLVATTDTAEMGDGLSV